MDLVNRMSLRGPAMRGPQVKLWTPHTPEDVAQASGPHPGIYRSSSSKLSNVGMSGPGGVAASKPPSPLPDPDDVSAAQVPWSKSFPSETLTDTGYANYPVSAELDLVLPYVRAARQRVLNPPEKMLMQGFSPSPSPNSRAPTEAGSMTSPGITDQSDLESLAPRSISTASPLFSDSDETPRTTDCSSSGWSALNLAMNGTFKEQQADSESNSFAFPATSLHTAFPSLGFADNDGQSDKSAVGHRESRESIYEDISPRRARLHMRALRKLSDSLGGELRNLEDEMAELTKDLLELKGVSVGGA